MRHSLKKHPFIQSLKKQRQMWLICIPIIIWVAIFCYYPMYGLTMAFVDYVPGKEIWECKFVGFKYFKNFFTSTDFPRLLRNTLAMSGLNITIGFLMPISEELMFRGLIFERISNFGSETAGAILTSLLFGLYHGTMIQLVYAFVFSLFMIFAYKRSGSFAAPVLFHMVSNLSALAMNQLSPLTSMQYSIGIVVFCLIGLFGLYELKKGRFFRVISLENDIIGEDDVESGEQM